MEDNTPAKPPEIQRLIQIENYLMGLGLAETSKDFAEKYIGENANGISDLKAGRKKLKFEHVLNLKISHPEFDVNWLLTGDGDMLLHPSGKSDKAKNRYEEVVYLNELIAEKNDRLKEKDERIKEKDDHLKDKQKLVSRLEELLSLYKGSPTTPPLTAG
jgi:hypothetical protein